MGRAEIDQLISIRCLPIASDVSCLGQSRDLLSSKPILCLVGMAFFAGNKAKIKKPE